MRASNLWLLLNDLWMIMVDFTTQQLQNETNLFCYIVNHNHCQHSQPQEPITLNEIQYSITMAFYCKLSALQKLLIFFVISLCLYKMKYEFLSFCQSITCSNVPAIFSLLDITPVMSLPGWFQRTVRVKRPMPSERWYVFVITPSSLSRAVFSLVTSSWSNRFLQI